MQRPLANDSAIVLVNSATIFELLTQFIKEQQIPIDNETYRQLLCNNRSISILMLFLILTSIYIGINDDCPVG